MHTTIAQTPATFDIKFHKGPNGSYSAVDARFIVTKNVDAYSRNRISPKVSWTLTDVSGRTVWTVGRGFTVSAQAREGRHSTSVDRLWEARSLIAFILRTEADQL